MTDYPTLLQNDQLKALSSPQRAEIFQRFRAMEKASVSEVAGEMGCSPESIAYHVRTLVKVSLLKPIDTRSTKRRAEVVYAPTATSYRLPTQSDDPVGHQLSHKVVIAGLRQTRLNFQRVSEAISTDHPELATKLHVVRTQIRLNAADQAKFFELIEAASEFARIASTTADKESDLLTWMSVVAPRSPKR